MCGLTVNVAVRVPEEVAVGVAAGLMQGQARVFAVKTATEVGVRAIQDHKIIEWNTCRKCRLSEGTDNM